MPLLTRPDILWTSVVVARDMDFRLDSETSCGVASWLSAVRDAAGRTGIPCLDSPRSPRDRTAGQPRCDGASPSVHGFAAVHRSRASGILFAKRKGSPGDIAELERRRSRRAAGRGGRRMRSRTELPGRPNRSPRGSAQRFSFVFSAARLFSDHSIPGREQSYRRFGGAPERLVKSQRMSCASVS